MKIGLIQLALKGDADDTPAAIRDRMIEAHLPFIDEAAAAGVQVLCFQEVFNQPYFCPGQDPKWYAAAEPIPDGPTTRLMCERARRHGMVIVVPIYEQAMTGGLLQHRRGHRRGRDVSRQVPARPTSRRSRASTRSSSSSRAIPGGRLFDTAYCKLGVYICYDRHFPEGLAGARAERGGVHREPIGHGGRAEPVSVEARAARRRGRQRCVHRRHQPSRRRVAVEHRPVLRNFVRGRPKGPNPGRGQRGPRRAGRRGPGPGTWFARSATSGSSSATGGREMYGELTEI